MKRRRKRADGTYSDSESYHSEDSGMEGGGLHKKGKKKKRREHGSDSEHSYYSEVSEGGTRRRKRRKRIRDEHGNVIGYESDESYTSPSGKYVLIIKVYYIGFFTTVWLTVYVCILRIPYICDAN